MSEVKLTDLLMSEAEAVRSICYYMLKDLDGMDEQAKRERAETLIEIGKDVQRYGEDFRRELDQDRVDGA